MEHPDQHPSAPDDPTGPQPQTHRPSAPPVRVATEGLPSETPPEASPDLSSEVVAVGVPSLESVAGSSQHVPTAGVATDVPAASKPAAGEPPVGPSTEVPAEVTAAGVVLGMADPAERDWRMVVHEQDLEMYRLISRNWHGTLDGVLPRLSRVADHSVLWLAISAAMGLLGGRRERRTAVRAVVALGATSAVANLLTKPLARRSRPPQHEVPVERHVPLPLSSSFPSGHSASAAAFTTVVVHGTPALAVPVAALGAAVAYSRVYTGVHYPLDVVVGMGIGLSIGSAVCTAAPVARP